MGASTAVRGLPAPESRRMTRCECAETAFAAIRHLLREERLSLEEIARRTGCGRTCTACLPDLQAYLQSR